ncbi:MAG: DUF3299 domain-containing protein [Alphaproteobacteria bacterium]|nr:DUF3299 domain-containing protein [Alphaproteobacteria bacterium]
MVKSVLAGIAVVVLAATSALAEPARELVWNDLAPAAGPLENPFIDLSNDQYFEFIQVVWARAAKREGLISETSPDYLAAIEYSEKLKSEGVAVDALVAKAAEIAEEIERRNRATIGELQGQTIRMAGYALPLEFTGQGVMEFLLVPYVGACIHVPPPPPNQMVFVRLDEEFVSDGLFTPVWVTGQMSVEGGSRTLSYVDGVADIPTGYALDRVTVEPYLD